MSLNDLMIKKKKTACFPRQFEQSKVEWSIRRDKIFFPDAFEGHERLGSAAEDIESDSKDKARLEERVDDES